MHYYDGAAAPWGWWMAMALMMGLFLVAGVWAVVAVVRHSSDRPPTPPVVTPMSGSSPKRASEILDERFARGEIDAEEYLRRRDLLLDAPQAH